MKLLNIVALLVLLSTTLAMAATTTIQFRRGPEANLPARAAQGEPMWTTDTHKLYIGYSTGKVAVTGGGGTGSVSTSGATLAGHVAKYLDTTGTTLVDGGPLSIVASSGSYNDLSNKPTIPTIPSLAAVATSGAYPDLSSKPTLPTNVSCDSTTGKVISYNSSTGAFVCGTDQVGTSGGGITSLNALSGSSQTFSNDTNVTITSTGTTHTLGWVGTLADNRIASAPTWNAKLGSISDSVSSTSSSTAASSAAVKSAYDLASTKGPGTVTGITASTPLTGGTITTTGSIGIQTASGSQAGALSSTDWMTFNNKQNALGYTPLNAANNLSDVTASTARANLGLGTASTQAISAFEAAIIGGTTSQYWRGDKSWQTLPSIPSNTNQLTNGAGFITGNQTITASGDATGTGTTSLALTLAASGVTANTYTTPTITVDSKGRITSASANTINATYIGLGNANNTSDANKPVSTATQTALNSKIAFGIYSGVSLIRGVVNPGDGTMYQYISKGGINCPDTLPQNTICWDNTADTSTGTLAGLSDVTIATPATDQVLKYNGTKWVNGTATGGGSGTVTSIVASSPLIGGTITSTGSIGILKANASTDGYLAYTDWNTFNGKQANLGLVSLSGNTTKAATTSGTLVNGHCVNIDASGNLTDAGAACGTGGGGITSINTSSPTSFAAGTVLGSTGSVLRAATSSDITTLIGAGVYQAAGTYLTAASTLDATKLSGTASVNTSGTASNLSGAPALPNGVTATTQTAGDNSTKIATTAYVNTAVPATPTGGFAGLTSPVLATPNLTGQALIGTSATAGSLLFTDSDVTHGVTTLAPTGSYLLLGENSATLGGSIITSFVKSTATSTSPVEIKSVMANGPDDGVPAITLDAYQASGTGTAALGATKTLLQVQSAGTGKLTLLQTGALTITGGMTATTYNGHTFTTGSSTFTGTAAQTYTFPSATDTLVGRASTDTLTNKTLASPIITTPQSVITGSGLTAGSAYYMSSGGLALAKGDVATTLPALCVAISAAQCAYSGVYTTGSWTAGQQVYTSDTTAGALTATATSTTGHFFNKVGVALSSTQILIMPSLNIVGL